MSGVRRVIVDVDVGTDDFVAILLLLRADQLKQIKIEAISCSMGNAAIDHVCKNVVRLLEVTNRTDIPVFRGVSKPLIPPQHKVQQFHGVDGFGDLTYDAEPNLGIVDLKRSAAQAIRDLVIKYSNEISLICVAPLTNIALAIRLYDDFVPNIKDLWIMGGNYTAKGNVTSTAEYNFYIDPEAAYIVLDSVTKPIYMLTWETCLNSDITFEWRYNVFGKKQNPAIELLNRADRAVYRAEEIIWLPCDAFLAAAFLHPDKVILKKALHHATLELGGNLTRGQIVLDHLKRKKENITIIEEVDNKVFKELLMEL